MLICEVGDGHERSCERGRSERRIRKMAVGAGK